MKSLILAALLFFWPPWLSIESPVNPYDPSTRNALFLVHAMTREGTPQLADLSATAEGLVNGARETITVKLDATAQAGTFAVRKQWPNSGAWLVSVTLKNTTALVSIGANGQVAAVDIPMRTQSNGDRVPSAISAHEIDSTLATLAAARSR